MTLGKRLDLISYLIQEMLHSFPSPDQMTTQTDKNLNELVSVERSGG